MYRLTETLERISKRCETLKHVTEYNLSDISNDSTSKLEMALEIIDEVISDTLKNQKARGKDFISDDEVDELFKRINLTYGDR